MYTRGRGASWRGGRGSYGGWRGTSSSGSQPAAKTIERPPPLPLGGLIETIAAEHFKSISRGSSPLDAAKIKDPRLLASFNWASDGSLFFPGIPPVWNPPMDTPKLHQDSGEYFRDKNAAHFPSHPLEPAAKAVTAQDAYFDTQSLDIFACTSTLGNLLGCLKGEDRTFRFTVEKVGKTVFFVRRENAPDEKIPGPYGTGPKGHGHSFPEHYCEWREDVKKSESNQRIVSYDFSGLKLAVRFEADGYLRSELGKRDEDVDVDEHGELGSARAKTKLPEIDGIVVRHGGSDNLIPSHAIFELKTRSITKKDDDHLSAVLPRLWQAQIPWFIVALHQWGTFAPENITIKHVRKDVDAWEKDNEALLRSLGALLRKLIELARDPAMDKYEVVCQKPGVLEIRQQGGAVLAPLSDPFARIWAGRNASLSESDDGASVGTGKDSDNESLLSSQGSVDYTACSEDCGYCGRCRY